MKLFHWVKEIRSKKGVLHFKRYAIIETTYFSIYIHKIYEHDHDLDMHSHPWSFFGIILKGSYVEECWKQWEHYKTIGYRTKYPLSVGFGSRNYFHRIHRIKNGPVTSLFFTFGKHQPWYYQKSTTLVESKEYRKLKYENKY